MAWVTSGQMFTGSRLTSAIMHAVMLCGCHQVSSLINTHWDFIGVQAAGPTDSESGEDSAAAKRQRKAHQGPSALRPPTHSGTPPPSAAAPSPQHQSAHVNGHSEQRHSQGQRWQNEDEARGNRAGSIGAEGRSGSMEAPVTNGGDREQVAAAAPSVGKIKLKLRRPLSGDEYDESWFAEYIDRQPNLRGPITDMVQVKLKSMCLAHVVDLGTCLSNYLA